MTRKISILASLTASGSREATFGWLSQFRRPVPQATSSTLAACSNASEGQKYTASSSLQRSVKASRRGIAVIYRPPQRPHDPEMHQTKIGQQWHFGRRCMSGGQQEQSNPPIKATAGNVHYTYAATKTRMWLDQCRQVCVNFWRVETDRIRGVGRCRDGSAAGIDPRALLRCLPW